MLHVRHHADNGVPRSIQLIRRDADAGAQHFARLEVLLHERLVDDCYRQAIRPVARIELAAAAHRQIESVEEAWRDGEELPLRHVAAVRVLAAFDHVEPHH